MGSLASSQASPDAPFPFWGNGKRDRRRPRLSNNRAAERWLFITSRLRMMSDLTSTPPLPVAQRDLLADAPSLHSDSDPDPVAPEQPSPHRWRRKPKKPETRGAPR